MPHNTYVKSTTPSSTYASNGNIATFTMHENDRYPTSFSVVGARNKRLRTDLYRKRNKLAAKTFDSVVLGTLLILLYSLPWPENNDQKKMHYRLYTSVINIFNRHAINLVQFS